MLLTNDSTCQNSHDMLHGVTTTRRPRDLIGGLSPGLVMSVSADAATHWHSAMQLICVSLARTGAHHWRASTCDAWSARRQKRTVPAQMRPERSPTVCRVCQLQINLELLADVRLTKKAQKQMSPQANVCSEETYHRGRRLRLSIQCYAMQHTTWRLLTYWGKYAMM